MSSALSWAKAQSIIGARGQQDRAARQVLACMASYADAEDCCWVKISVMMFETCLGERSVQRAIQALLAQGHLRKTERRHLHNGRLIPVYELATERGPANTREALGQRRGVTCMSPGPAAPGDTGVTPMGDMRDGRRVTRESPRSSKSKEEAEGRLSQSAREGWASAFERVAEGWGASIPDGVSRPLDRQAWLAACEQGADPIILERSAGRYLAESDAVKRGRGKSLARWLADEAWRPWAAPRGAASPRFPCDQVRAAIVAKDGEDFARSYLDPARWDAEARSITPRTGLAYQRLAAGRWSASSAGLDVSLVDPTAMT